MKKTYQQSSFLLWPSIALLIAMNSIAQAQSKFAREVINESMNKIKQNGLRTVEKEIGESITNRAIHNGINKLDDIGLDGLFVKHPFVDAELATKFRSFGRAERQYLTELSSVLAKIETKFGQEVAPTVKRLGLDGVNQYLRHGDLVLKGGERLLRQDSLQQICAHNLTRDEKSRLVKLLGPNTAANLTTDQIGSLWSR